MTAIDAYSGSVSINIYRPYRYTVCLILSKTNPGTGYSRYTTLVCVSSYGVLIYYMYLTVIAYVPPLRVMVLACTTCI